MMDLMSGYRYSLVATILDGFAVSKMPSDFL